MFHCGAHWPVLPKILETGIRDGISSGVQARIPGGYLEGSPLDPMSSSTYGVYGYNSILYTVYSACIRPYITSSTVVLEIGPGRGAWSKTFLHRNCRKLYAVDVADPAHTISGIRR